MGAMGQKAGTATAGGVVITVDGVSLAATAGQSVAAALIAAGVTTLRRSPGAGAPRGAFCLMGACQECTVLIDGRPARACLTPVRAGLAVTLGGPMT